VEFGIEWTTLNPKGFKGSMDKSDMKMKEQITYFAFEE